MKRVTVLEMDSPISNLMVSKLMSLLEGTRLDKATHFVPNDNYLNLSAVNVVVILFIYA